MSALLKPALPAMLLLLAAVAGAAHPACYPGCEDAYLAGADLRGESLFNAILYEAILAGADLRGADLSGADLRYADLRGADLRGADLRFAFSMQSGEDDAPNLRGADLRGARLPPREVWDRAWNTDSIEGADLRGVIHDDWSE